MDASGVAMGFAGWLKGLAVCGLGVFAAVAPGAMGTAEAACALGLVQAPPLLRVAARAR